MIVDTSALIAILRAEADASIYSEAIRAQPERRMSAVSFTEAAVVIDAGGDPIASRRFDDLLREASIVIEPVTEEQARIARAAYRDFGKGRGNSAGLNFGDCFSYALSRSRDEPLLFKGDDFSRTDVESALD